MLRLPTESWRTTWNEAACWSGWPEMSNVGVNLVIAAMGASGLRAGHTPYD